MQYTQKPVTVDAFQFGVDDFPAWFITQLDDPHVLYNPETRPPQLMIRTANRTHLVKPGAFILRQPDGSVDVLQEEVFRDVYSPAPQAEPVIWAFDLDGAVPGFCGCGTQASHLLHLHGSAHALCPECMAKTGRAVIDGLM